jgi:winged helix domain-containing protein/ATPase family protein associated with various cellular activities (AAA)
MVHLRSLDVLLKLATDRARMLYAVDPDNGSLRGVYIDEEEIDRLIRRDSETLGCDLLVSEVLRDYQSSPHIEQLRRRWGFTDFDTAALLLALAPEIDLRYERIYGYLQDDVTKRKPSVDLALSLFCENQDERILQRQRFAPEAPLLASGWLRLLSDSAHPESSLLSQYLRLEERAVRAMLGDDGIDSQLSDFCERICPAPTSVFVNDTSLRSRLTLFVNQSGERGQPVRLLFSGPATTAKGTAAEVLAASTAHSLLIANMERCPRWRTEPVEIASILKREAIFSDAVLFVNNLSPAASDEPAAKSLIDSLSEHPGIVVLGSESDWTASIAGADQFLNITFELPGYESRYELWKQLIGDAGIRTDANSLTTLANNFRLSPEQIAKAVGTAQQRLEWQLTIAPSISETEIESELFAAARRQTGLELAALTSKLQLVHEWSDIVLPEDTLELLREICQRVKHNHDVMERGGFGKKLSSGKGTSVLFAGSSGTGKTMAAGIIANELALDLFRIDLSSVVSKYIGETEKNLERIFNAAGQSNSVLLFDEADALFGKRSAVSDAHDRYANVEISYLLQKMEEYEGITVLTSNLRANIDEGFWRRLAFTVHFPFPEEQTREQIWKKVWPAETIVDEDVDFVQLAHRFRLSGGNIRNIALAAAFLAAAARRPVSVADILRATRREYAKVGKNLTAAELEEVVN